MIDRTNNPWNNDKQLAKNKAEWDAWLEWKRVCSVNGCSVDNRRILSNVVFNAFCRKLQFVSQIIYNDWKRGGKLEESRDEFIQEFDTGIEIKKHEGVLAEMRRARGEEPQREETLTTASPTSKVRLTVSPKDYKSLAFNRALTQPDDPLRAFRGALVGPQGIINSIVEHFLLYSCGLSLDWFTDDGTKKRSIGYITKSVNVMEEKRQEKEIAEEKNQWNNLVTDENAPEEEPPADPLDAFVTPPSFDVDREALNEFRKELRKTYTPRQMAILLAHFNGMPISSPALQVFYGAKHSAVQKAFHAIVTMARDPATGDKVIKDIPGISALMKKFHERLDFMDRDILLTITDVFQMTIAKEPGGEAFLCALSNENGRKAGAMPRL